MFTPHEAFERFVPGARPTVTPSVDGAVHGTYVVTLQDSTDPAYVLQRMHSIFAPNVMEDIEAVCRYAKGHGFDALPVFEPVYGTRELVLHDEGTWWRVMRYVDGSTHEMVPGTEYAYSAGLCIGTFHAAMQGFTAPLVHALPHFHDTQWVMENLRRVYAEADVSVQENCRDAVDFVLREYPVYLETVALQPVRLIHGDLKISNVRFAREGADVCALLDLDTLMYAPLAVEMGDALRSWCNPGGEDAKDPTFDRDLYDHALRGYHKGVGVVVTDDELHSVPHGVALITLELAARFLTDAIEERYFVHNTERYPTLRAQNLTRAQVQLALYRDMVRQTLV